MIKNITDKQTKKITTSVLALVASANESSQFYRQITPLSALTIINRSLTKTNTLPFSIREYLAARDVSDFISVLQKNKSALPRLRNTDLLPVCHPGFD